LNKTLKRKLEYHYKAFDKSKLEPDPLQFPHKYKRKNDIEMIAFVSSVFAYGNITQIIRTLNKVTSVLGEHPVNYILQTNEIQIKKDFKNIKHRFFNNEDVVNFFLLLKYFYSNHNSLEEVFLIDNCLKEKNIGFCLEHFSAFLLKTTKVLLGNKCLSNGMKFMFPLPSKGSACKRMNLFLRWMVRKDELDFGLWTRIDKSKLIIPVDTHVARICKELKLTKRENVCWQMAEEITNNLKKYDRIDPVKYDFAVCHIGMRKLKF